MKENKEEAAAKMKEVKAKMANKLKSFFWINYTLKNIIKINSNEIK